MNCERREMVMRQQIGPRSIVEVTIVGEPMDLEALALFEQNLAILRQALQHPASSENGDDEPGSSGAAGEKEGR